MSSDSSVRIPVASSLLSNEGGAEGAEVPGQRWEVGWRGGDNGNGGSDGGGEIPAAGIDTEDGGKWGGGGVWGIHGKKKAEISWESPLMSPSFIVSLLCVRGCLCVGMCVPGDVPRRK